MSLSERDLRQQQRVGAARHLLTCDTCASLADLVTRRQRRLLAVMPPAAGLMLFRWSRAHPVSAAAAGTGVAGTAAAIGLAVTSAPAVAHPRPLPVTRTAPAPSAMCQLTMPAGRTMVGRRVSAGVTVASVPANEGFFVDSCHGRRVWVQLSGRGESPVDVKAHDRLHLTGTVARTTPGVLAAQHLPRHLVAVLHDAGVELDVHYGDVTARPRRGDVRLTLPAREAVRPRRRGRLSVE
jgi:hypothetical protein